MKRIPSLILTAVLALSPAPAFADAIGAWNPITDTVSGRAFSRSVSAVCAAGNSCDAPTGTTANGLNLSNVQWVMIEVCAADGQTITDGDGIQIYILVAGGEWGALNVATYPVKTGGKCAWVQGDSPAAAIPVPPRGYLQAIPAAMTTSAGALTVRIFASDRNGNPL